MNTIQLKGIITKWWEYNKGLAQVAEGKYFIEQVHDHKTGFKEYTKEGYQKDESDFEIVRAKDVTGGIAIHLKSGTNEVDGILNIESGVWQDKVGGGDTETLTFIGARIGGE
jgi:hypothetical protein